MANNESRNSWMQRNRRTLLTGGPVLLLLAVGFFYLTGGRYVATDDAYVQVARTDISASTDGRVVAIEVKDNQEVHAGDVLFRIDDRDFKIAVQDAEAKLAAAKLQIAALKATYRQRSADVKAAEDTLAYTRREFKRQTTLVKQGISSQAQFDQAQHTQADAEQKQNAAEQQRANVLASLGDNPDIDVDDHPTVKQVQAMLDQAKLNLSYTIVEAPTNGTVSKVEQLQVGNYIRKAAPLFSLMSDKNVWIEANFKENELTHMRPGQEATITVDSYPGKTFHGKVESLSPGTGSSFSLLPPENASGNWVKVVQRLPVRIIVDDADPEKPLHSGLSAMVKVDTHYSRLGGGK